MKNYNLLLMSLLLFSCSQESDIAGTTEVSNALMTARLAVAKSPGNDLNPFDKAGSVYASLLDTYYQGQFNDTTVAQVYNRVRLLAATHTGFSELNGSPYTNDNVAGIIAIISSPQASLQAIFSNGSLSFGARASLSGFIDNLILHKDDEFDVIYGFILGYESMVMANGNFTTDEKRILLTTASIERFSAEYRKRRKDHDWELLVGNVVATLDGAVTDAPSAIITSLTVVISNNSDAQY